MGITSRPRPVRAGQKIRLEHLLQQPHRRLLHDLVLQGRNRDRSPSPVLFRYVDPTQRLRPVRLALETLPELLDAPPTMTLVILVRNLIYPGTGILTQVTKCLLQCLGREKVSNRVELTRPILLGQFS